MLVLFLAINTSIKAQSINDSITIELSELSKKNNLVGFGVAIVNKDSILFAKGFGYADKDTKSPYTIQTVQPIASISKTLLGVAVMKAQEMGKLNLNDQILKIPSLNCKITSKKQLISSKLKFNRFTIKWNVQT